LVASHKHKEKGGKKKNKEGGRWSKLRPQPGAHNHAAHNHAAHNHAAHSQDAAYHAHIMTFCLFVCLCGGAKEMSGFVSSGREPRDDSTDHIKQK